MVRRWFIVFVDFQFVKYNSFLCERCEPKQIVCTVQTHTHSVRAAIRERHGRKMRLTRDLHMRLRLVVHKRAIEFHRNHQKSVGKQWTTTLLRSIFFLSICLLESVVDAAVYSAPVLQYVFLIKLSFYWIYWMSTQCLCIRRRRQRRRPPATNLCYACVLPTEYVIEITEFVILCLINGNNIQPLLRR